MDDLIHSYLKTILNDEPDEEIINYMKHIKSSEDYDEFMDNIINKSNRVHMDMYQKLKSALFPNSKLKPTQPRRIEKDQKPSTSNVSKNNKKSQENVQENNPSTSQEDKHKKPKFVPVDLSSANATILKKGRHPCNCEARKHRLINNCVNCGRIVCEQEGSGPCFFCDRMVGTQEELKILASNDKVSDKLYNRLKEQKTSKEWKKAIETRDKLLNRDKNKMSSEIFDEQSDYYKTKSDDRTQIKYVLDLASRKIIAEVDEFDKHKEKLLKGIGKILESDNRQFPKELYEINDDYDESLMQTYKKKELEAKETDRNDRIRNPSRFRIVNENFAANIDKGMCLSMHQPWASLLVAGIKMHEGRTWCTDHIGKLWIHAAGKEPEDEEVLAVEEMYRKYYNDPELVFPRKYPMSCLLGRVTVEKCLPQNEYRKLYPNGESDSPYVLICSNPQILPIFFSMPGQHKIFQLPKEVHKRAKEILIYSERL